MDHTYDPSTCNSSTQLQFSNQPCMIYLNEYARIRESPRQHLKICAGGNRGKHWRAGRGGIVPVRGTEEAAHLTLLA